jgi:TonB family protein
MRIGIGLVVSLISIQAQVAQPTDVEGWKSRGFGLLGAGHLTEAAAAYERATNLKPNDPGAHLWLGSAYMLMSFGAPSPRNVANASRARTEYKRVLELDAESPMALAGLAAMSFYEAADLQGSEKLSKLHEARDWNKRVISADRTNKQAYLSLGVIAWAEFSPAWLEARAADGLKPQDTGPLHTAASRTKLLSQYGPLIEDGIANLRQAINIDPQDATAMAFAGTLVSERADLRDARDQYSRDLTEATAWTQRATDARREKSLRPQPAAVGTAAWFDALVKVLPPPPTDVDGWKQYGVAWFVNARYQPAADAFERAAIMNPQDVAALLYLGTSYMQMYIPGEPSPGNIAYASRAEVAFTKVLELNGNNTTALALLTSMSYWRAGGGASGDERIRKLEEARAWNRRWLAVDPQNKQAHYWAATIIWLDLHRALMAARANAHLKPEDSTIPSVATRLELTTKYGAMVDDGIAHLRRAIELDPQYADAMAYLDLLIRERAQYRDTPEQFSRDVAEAYSWAQRSLAARRTRAQGPGRGAPAPGATLESLAETRLESLAAFAITPPPPPPPPPPPAPPMPPKIGRIEITGVREEVAEMVRDRLRVRVGDPAGPETIGHVTAEIRQIDEHSRVNVTLGADGPPFSGGAILRIAISSFAFPLGPDSVTYEPLPDPTGKRIMLDPKVAAANLVTKVNPTYPALVKQVRIQGAVQLMATVGTDGRILNLQVLSGHPLLVPAALKAVKQWVFKPTLVNGNAVEVNTPVTINFTLTGQ